MARLIGQSIGTALVAVIFSLTAYGRVTAGGARLALMCGAAFTATAGVISSLRRLGLQPD
jgi:hypothetical protein